MNMAFLIDSTLHHIFPQLSTNNCETAQIDSSRYNDQNTIPTPQPVNP
jgi:hypothetical protein